MQQEVNFSIVKMFSTMMYTVWKIGLTLHLVMESPHT